MGGGGWGTLRPQNDYPLSQESSSLLIANTLNSVLSSTLLIPTMNPRIFSLL